MASKRRFVCATLCVSAALSASADSKPKTKAPAKPIPKKIQLQEAYYAGEPVKLHSGPYEKGERTLVVGPWNMGPRVSPKPNDKRPNIYFVVPGSQHHIDAHPEYDHTEILSFAPEEPKEFDVYWAVVLDPTLKQEFTAERQLLMATQETFTPGEDFTFDQIPSAGFMKRLLKISSLDGLEKYRRPDGTLPRMAIITAEFGVRFSVEKLEERQPETPTASPSSEH